MARNYSIGTKREQHLKENIRQDDIYQELLYDPRRLKRNGKRKRIKSTISLTENTFNKLGEFVALYKGGFKSAFIELALEFAFIVFSNDIKSDEGKKLIQSVVKRIRRINKNNASRSIRISENIRLLSDSILYSRYVDLEKEYMDGVRKKIVEVRVAKRTHIDEMPDEIITISDILERDEF